MATKCHKCFGRILSHSRIMICFACSNRAHIACYDVNRDELSGMNQWYCEHCLRNALPFVHIHDDNEYKCAVYEFLSDERINFEDLDKRIFIPFELNTSDYLPMTDVDPDTQFYSDVCFSGNMGCNYYTIDSFNRLCQNIITYPRRPFSIFHHNIRSLPAHHSEMLAYLNSFSLQFDIIGLTESWLNDNNHDLYDLDGYVHCKTFRETRRGGGVSLFLRDFIQFKMRQDITLDSPSTESIFVELDKEIYQTPQNIIIGVIYRAPDNDLDLFNEVLDSTLKKITKEKKSIYLIGDYNIDLLRTNEHNRTSDFLDIMYSYGMIPLIHKPTRITKHSSTLIDNIFTNQFSQDLKSHQGLLYSDLTDHFPVFHINESVSTIDEDAFFWKRSINAKNIQNFLNDVKTVDWDSVQQNQDAQSAYSEFHHKITNTYDKHFPFKKYKTGYRTRQPWLTSILKKSITKKNKLFVFQKKHPSDENIKIYKLYKKELTKLLHGAQRKFYKEQLAENKSDLKRSWTILKQVINKRVNTKQPLGFKDNGSVISDKIQISNKFNEFFVNVGPTLASKIPSSAKTPDSYLRNEVVESLFLSPVNDAEILKIFVNLKDSAAGWDGIKANIIKKISHIIVQPLVHICNLSFTQGIFPRELKLANVVPIF